MREKLNERLEDGRMLIGEYGSEYGDLYGAFLIPGPTGAQLKILSSGVDSEFGWEHVSVSCERRTPTWLEMCYVKDAFWNDDEVVMQLHPGKDQYVNHHPFCLHLWKPLRAEIPLPPTILVGPLGETE